MLKGILSLCAGILLAGYLPTLPSWPLVSGLILGAALCGCLVFCDAFTSRIFINHAFTCATRSLCIPLGGAMLGLAWGAAHGHYLNDLQLAPALEGSTVVVTGRINGLPHSDRLKQRFLLDVETVKDAAGQPIPVKDFPQRLSLSWYRGPDVFPGQHWQLNLKVKRPRGFVNPAGFDYQAWLLRQGVGATGYVRNSPLNRLLSIPLRDDIHQLRSRLFQWLARNDPLEDNLQPVDGDSTTESHLEHDLRGLLIALVIGDRSLIGVDQWQVLQDTGTNHLIAISGLHIGLAAALGFGLGKVLGAMLNLLLPRVTAMLVGGLCSLAAAYGYAALAGFSLPTQRALLMVAIVQLAILSGRVATAPRVLALALLAVLLWDPLAGLDMGFWLSFSAVAWLCYGLGGRIHKPSAKISAGKGLAALLARAQHWLMGFLQAQLVIFAGLLLPTLILVHQVAWLAPVANLVAIPLVSLITVPLLLIATGLFTLADEGGWIATHAVSLAEWSLDGLWRWLHWLLSASGHFSWYPANMLGAWSMLLGLVSAALWIAPRGVPGRWLGALGLVAALYPRSMPPAPLTVTVMDVGQGLAIVVQTRDNTLVYDTGPRYSERFDAGSGIIAPYLKQLGVQTVDVLVLSHGDGDHAGGLAGLTGQLPVARLLAGEPSRTPDSEDCRAALPWQWQGVSFEVLDRETVSLSADSSTGNDRSCVLLIRYGDERILLPGDIGRDTEAMILAARPDLDDLALLVAPHHGSITSSSAAFVNSLAPDYVIFSAAYNSRYGHPHPLVVERYLASDAVLLNTADHGAIQFQWQEGQQLSVRWWREYAKRYWMDS